MESEAQKSKQHIRKKNAGKRVMFAVEQSPKGGVKRISRLGKLQDSIAKSSDAYMHDMENKSDDETLFVQVNPVVRHRREE